MDGRSLPKRVGKRNAKRQSSAMGRLESSGPKKNAGKGERRRSATEQKKVLKSGADKKTRGFFVV